LPLRQSTNAISDSENVQSAGNPLENEHNDLKLHMGASIKYERPVGRGVGESLRKRTWIGGGGQRQSVRSTKRAFCSTFSCKLTLAIVN